MTYPLAIEGLKALLEGVTGIAQVLDYEPASVQKLPTIYLQLDSITPTGELPIDTYRVIARLLIRYQDNEKAELELKPFVNSIYAALRADPFLVGRFTRGGAKLTEPARAGYVRIGSPNPTTYRSLDVYVDIVDKEQWT